MPCTLSSKREDCILGESQFGCNDGVIVKGENRLTCNINIVELFYAFNYLSILIEMTLVCSYNGRVEFCIVFSCGTWYRPVSLPLLREDKSALTSLPLCLIWCRVDGYYVVAQCNCTSRTTHLRRVVGNLIIIAQHKQAALSNPLFFRVANQDVSNAYLLLYDGCGCRWRYHYQYFYGLIKS